MHNEFTGIFERDGDWVIAYCPEIPGANGQGRTKEEARTSLADAIGLILEDRREDGLRGVPPDASAKRLLCGETELVAPALAPAWMRAQARGWLPFTLDEPDNRRCRSRPSPH